MILLYIPLSADIYSIFVPFTAIALPENCPVIQIYGFEMSGAYTVKCVSGFKQI
jgi:hypothetical protein